MDIVIDQEDKLDEAEVLCRRVFEAKEEALGLTHPETLEAMGILADHALARQGKFDEVEALHRRVLAAKEEALGPTHPETLDAVGRLACHIFYPLARAASNRELVRQGLAPHLGPPGPPPLEGPSHVIQSKYIEAEALYRRAIEGDEDDREARERLARLLEIRGEAAAAEELRAQILARWGVEGVDYEE